MGNGQAKQVLWRGTTNPSLMAKSGPCEHYITYNGIKQAAARLLHCLGSSENPPFLGEGGTQAPVAQPADCRICKKSRKKPCLTKLSPNDGPSPMGPVKDLFLGDIWASLHCYSSSSTSVLLQANQLRTQTPRLSVQRAYFLVVPQPSDFPPTKPNK